jgi:hypothetical protein
MVELVERMLDPSAGSELALRNSKGQALHKQLPKAKTPHVWADSSRPTANGHGHFGLQIADRQQGSVWDCELGRDDDDSRQLSATDLRPGWGAEFGSSIVSSTTGR